VNGSLQWLPSPSGALAILAYLRSFGDAGTSHKTEDVLAVLIDWDYGGSADVRNVGRNARECTLEGPLRCEAFEQIAVLQG
jgi:hypothetical protein